jgi:glycosyltransferase involved in cell wall biosynthesis
MSQANARQFSEQHITALLGRRDTPTDALEDYCRYLAVALREHQIEMDLARIPWPEHGWTNALQQLRRQAADWRGRWVLVQYTALSWSKRGFPRRFLRVVKTLRRSATKIAIVFHDVEPYPGTRLIDRFRRLVQLNTMRSAMALTDLAVFTVPLERISWISRSPARSIFVPVGANLPVTPQTHPTEPQQIVNPRSSKERPLTVAVFGITGGRAGTQETQLIIDAARHAAQHVGAFRLSIFGRYSDSRESVLRSGLRGCPVDLCVEGVLHDHEVVRRFWASDVLLFVRGAISSRRGSAIAAIACGVPVIAFTGAETAPPITDAGVVLVPPGDTATLRDALVRVLADSAFRATLAQASRNAYDAHFSWRAIASRFSRALVS